MSKENQDKVAYMKVKEWGEQGLKPAQIASMWNSGKANWEGNVGVNKMGVQFDTPSYVKKVGEIYDSYTKGGQGPTDTTTPSTAPDTTQVTSQEPTTPKKSGGLLSQFATGIGSSILGTAKGVGDLLGLKPTAFGERLLTSSQNLDQGTAKDIGKIAGYGGQVALAGGMVARLLPKASIAKNPLVSKLLGGPELVSKMSKKEVLNGIQEVLSSKKLSYTDMMDLKKILPSLMKDAGYSTAKKAGLLKLLLGYEGITTASTMAENTVKSLWDKYIGSQIPNQGEVTSIEAAP